MKKTTNKATSSKLTIGPLFFHWSAEKRIDFYNRIADEADVDVVYLGEVVCSKREHFFEDHFMKTAERLQKSGKEVVFSTLALVTSEREMENIHSRIKTKHMVEANDVACLAALEGKPHVVGPFINVFNESARDFMIRNKAKRIVIPVEASLDAIKLIANKSKAEMEVQVFGRQPLSVAMRCYSARAHGRQKNGCQFVCGLSPDGLAAETLDGQQILAVNGTQTLSHGYAVSVEELPYLQKAGVTHFRLSPQDVDMVTVSSIYRSAIDQKISAKEAMKKLRALCKDVPFINGFMRGSRGMDWVGD